MKNWFMNLSLSKKLILVLVLVGLIPMMIASLISISASRSQITQQAFSQLDAVRENKAEAVTRYFETVRDQLTVMANSATIANAAAAFNRSFYRLPRSERLTEDDLANYRASLIDFYQNQFGKTYNERNPGKTINTAPLYENLDDATVTAQYHYISNNQFPLGEKEKLNRGDGRAVYHNNHETYHDSIREFLYKFGFYDIFIVNIETGHIVYSVFKELDFGTSLLTGPYSDTNFADAFREASELEKGQYVLKDYRPYGPSYDSAASFIASPIYQGEKKVGVLIFQMPLEPINAIMTSRAGMGETGETYLVGDDFLMRSDSYNDSENRTVSASFARPTTGSVRTKATESAFSGETGTGLLKNYADKKVLSAYSPINLGDYNWVMIAEIDQNEALAGVTKVTWQIITFAIIGIVLIAGFAMVIAKMVSTPIVNLSSAIQTVQRSGRFKTSLVNDFTDEVGETSRAFNQLLDNLDKSLSGTNHVLDALSKGEFETRAPENFPGQLNDLAAGANFAIQKVASATQEQKAQSEKAAQNAKLATEAAAKAEAQAQETLVIKQALDVSATAVMIADANFNVTYQNESSNELMTFRESQLRKSLPNFNASKIMGESIDQFHENPAHQRQLLASLTDTYQSDIKVSGLTFRLSATPIKDTNGKFLGAVIEWLDLTEQLEKAAEERLAADENYRIRQALDSSSTGTMIADPDFKVIYGNQALHTLMNDAEDDLRKEVASFDATKIIGSSIDDFHHNPSHQRSLLSSITSTYTTDVKIGSRTMNISATPIINHENQRIGTVIEWKDRTAEVNTEREIDAIIESASRGDFSARIDTASKEGFFKSIGEGLNQLISTTNIAITDVKQLFSALAQGDLSRTMDSEYQGDFAQLKTDANNTVLKLREIIHEITDSSTSIARAAAEISAGNAELSRRTEEQASSLEETASSMEEMTTIVGQTQDNAGNAEKFTESAIKIARKGNESVSETSVAMSGISEASEKISNIIGVIDEIAFQTNLLALNAAVEAARAGEQGRGFAVVAGEVRNLAQRSAEAAKEIKQLIQESVSKVNEGESLVATSAQTLNSIVAEIEQVGATMQQLSESAREQYQGIQQVNTAITQMDSMTQENAALVEEASASSESMADQAAKLDQLMSFFK